MRFYLKVPVVKHEWYEFEAETSREAQKLARLEGLPACVAITTARPEHYWSAEKDCEVCDEPIPDGPDSLCPSCEMDTAGNAQEWDHMQEET